MTDSEQLRSARKRAHARGDHSKCVAGRCPHARAEIPELTAVPDAEESAGLTYEDLKAQGYGPTTATAIQMVASLPYGEADPRYLVAAATLQLAQEFDRAPTAVLNAELRRNSAYLLEGITGQADILDEIRARAAAKTVALLVKSLDAPRFGT